jgi:hypothetical protein
MKEASFRQGGRSFFSGRQKIIAQDRVTQKSGEKP